MKSFTVRCRKAVLRLSLTSREQRVWRNSWQVLNSLPSHQWDGKGQVSGSVKGLGAGFKCLNCCHILVFGLLCGAFGSKSKGWQEFLGEKPCCTLEELLIFTGAGWRQSMATVPGGGADIPWPSVWTPTLLIYEFCDCVQPAKKKGHVR